MNKIYLDNAATTKIDQKVVDNMIKAHQLFGNPSSLHFFGQEASKALNDARNFIAFFFGCEFEEIVFTSGGSEADNLAIRGTVEANKSIDEPHVITTMIEHHAVLHTVQDLEKQGKIDATYIKPNEEGLISPESILEAIRDNTVLVSVMFVNNETGAVQPIASIGNIIENANIERIKRGLPRITFHTDAVQAPEFFSLGVKYLKVDLLSISAHKLHGPRGIGLLYVKKGSKLCPQICGGKQEFGYRAGTENLAGIFGLSAALEVIVRERADSKDSYVEEKADFPLMISDSIKHVSKLKEKLISGLLSIDNVRINGSAEYSSPAILNVSFLNAEGEAIILNLDFEGIAVSSGSACTSRTLEPSHVLTAMGVEPKWSHGAIRFSLSRETTEEEIDKLCEVLPGIISKLRQMSPLKPEEM